MENGAPRAMYNTALRILKNSFEAEDMMQDSFLIAFTKLGTFKGEVTFGSWLKRIVINKRKEHSKWNFTWSFIYCTVLKYVRFVSTNFRTAHSIHL